ncbi:MAG TPA: C1 family peptidase [Actinopolymorphaceae bacterium]
MTGQLEASDLELLRKEFASDPTTRLLQNALTQNKLDDIALDREIVTSIDPSMSNGLDDWTVTNQKQSGRCWLFAGLNLLRVGAMRSLKLKNFEYSQNHTMFFDKIERSNYFLNSIEETSDRDIDDRTVAYILDSAVGDGGQWNMFVALVQKHGLVPKSAMPETVSSSATGPMNKQLQRVLRQGARDLRAAAAGDREQVKQSVLSTIWRILCLHLGTPPESFVWQWQDDDKVFHRDGDLTPLRFRDKYVTVDLADYVCLVNDPRAGSPYGKTYTVEHLGNVLGAPPVVYLNVEMPLIKQLASERIVGGEPVWFGCDVGQQMRRDLGIWDANLLDTSGLYDTEFTLDKADRLLHHETVMTHAMLFTGVDMLDGAPRRWRVENSWGDAHGSKGFYTMNDSWFSEYVFEIAAPKSALSPELLAALDEEPTVLPAWDPMGALAR